MNFTITLTEKDLEILDKGLQLLPFGQVSGLYFNIKNQVSAQLKEDKEEVDESAD